MIDKDKESKKNLNPIAIIEIAEGVLGINPLKNVKCRRRDLVEARQISMYFIKKYSLLSLAAIGSIYVQKNGKRKDHATVLHAVKTISGYLENDKRVIDICTDIDINIKRAMPHIRNMSRRSLSQEIDRIKSFNIKLINRAIYLKEVIDSMPEDVRKNYFGNDQYFYPTKQEDTGVGMVHES